MGRGIVMGGGLIGLMAVVAIVGYMMVGGNDAPPATGDGGEAAPGGAVLPREGGYLQRNIAALDHARKTAWEAEIHQALEFYKAENGAYPSSLDALEDLRELPEGYEWSYDPASGAATIVGGR